MREVPFIFSTPMVRAILDGTKNLTRRTIKGIDNSYRLLSCGRDWANGRIVADFEHILRPELIQIWAKAAPADIIWVRETWCDTGIDGTNGEILYMLKSRLTDELADYYKGHWCPSIHMPKAACRLWLPVVEVRVERLQDITAADAMNEGILRRICPNTGVEQYYHYLKDKWGPDPVHSYQTLWEKINGPGSWAANPWVWVYRWAVLRDTFGYMPKYTRQNAIDFITKGR